MYCNIVCCCILLWFLFASFFQIIRFTMSEVWLISAPGENTPQKTWDTLNRATSAENLSANYKFNIPELRVRED